MFDNFANFFTNMIIFCVILLLYIHVQFQLSTSNDLEIYEIEHPSKDTLENLCDARQPILLECDGTADVISATNKKILTSKYPTFDVQIRERDTQTSLPLRLELANKLFDKDADGMYFSEDNADFFTETGCVRHIQEIDAALRPSLTSNCRYDIMFGSVNATTPFRYELNYRNFFMVTQGSATVKMAPPKNSKYLHSVPDYEIFEFASPVNPWNLQAKYETDFDKVKCLEIHLVPGKVLFIPAYWYYSFKFAENTSITVLKYRTYANNLAISPHILMFGLQNQNIKRTNAARMVFKTDELDVEIKSNSKSTPELESKDDVKIEKEQVNSLPDVSSSDQIVIETA